MTRSSAKVDFVPFAGGLIFGWNAFALILKAQGNYDRGCQQNIAGRLNGSKSARIQWSPRLGKSYKSDLIFMTRHYRSCA